jgi:coenzyme F420-reducing hydrogenase delta subunit
MAVRRPEMATAKYLGNPEFKTEKEEIAYVAKILGCKPEQVSCTEISNEQLNEIANQITETKQI